MSEMPSRFKEKKGVWEEGKEYVLQVLREKKKMPSAKMIRLLNEKCNYKGETSGYRTVNKLIELKQIHYASVPGMPNARVLFPGPRVGRIPVISKDMYQDMMTGEPQIERTMTKVGVASCDAAKLCLEEEEIVEATIVDTNLEARDEVETMTTEAIAIQHQPELGTDAVDLESRKIALDSARRVIGAVDKEIERILREELERLLSPATKAQLRMAAVMSQAVGFEVDPAESPLAVRDALKSILANGA